MILSLPRALQASLDSLRHAAAALSLASSGRHTTHHHHHPYDQVSARRSGEEASGEKKAESRVGLRPGTGGGKSLGQNSSYSAEVIEMHDMGSNRTGDDAV